MLAATQNDDVTAHQRPRAISSREGRVGKRGLVKRRQGQPVDQIPAAFLSRSFGARRSSELPADIRPTDTRARSSRSPPKTSGWVVKSSST